jgi:hypothetical protein
MQLSRKNVNKRSNQLQAVRAHAAQLTSKELLIVVPSSLFCLQKWTLLLKCQRSNESIGLFFKEINQDHIHFAHRFG